MLLILVSVIIPCYNGWKYMGRCLKALENQTLSPYEVIIADDCSIDDSFEQIEAYMKTSSLNIIHIKNKINCGPGATRKNALEVATGQYVSFCDCDDWYENDFIEKMCKSIEDNFSDIVICDTYSTYDDRKLVAHVTRDLVGNDKKNILTKYAASLCRLVVKRELFQNLNMPEIYNAEDAAIVPQLFVKACKISIVDEPLYNYYFRENSASNKPSEKTYIYIIQAYKVIEEVLKNTYRDECEFLGVKMVCYGATLNAFKVGISSKKVKTFLNEFTCNYPDWYSNKYLKDFNKVKKIYLLFLKYKFYFLVKIMSKLHFKYTKIRRKK